MTEAITETSVTPPHRWLTAPCQDACLVRIYPTGPGMGRRYALAEVPLVIGRTEDCDIPVQDFTVSRRHARIESAGDGHWVVDQGSTNGTFVNDRPVTRQLLQDGDYLRVGGCIFRFLTGGNVENEYHEELYRLSIIDALTGAHNKRSLLEFLDRELARSARFSRPLSLVLFDVDHFKAVNDGLGHLGGDYTLRELAACVQAIVRKEELFARYGGEEFVVVLPETTLEGGVRVGERLRTLVEGHAFRFDGQPYQVTISLGVVSTAGDDSLTVADFLRGADERLYEAKRQGRNRVVGGWTLAATA